MLLSFCYIYKDFVRQLKAFPPSFCHFCACEMSPGWGHLITWMDPTVGHLNGILARVGGNLNNNFQKSQMPGGLPGGMLKLRFDRYIIWKTPASLTVGKTSNRAVENLSQRKLCLSSKYTRSQRRNWSHQTSASACLFGNDRSSQSWVRIRLITKCVYYEWASDWFAYPRPCNNSWYARASQRVKNM